MESNKMENAKKISQPVPPPAVAAGGAWGMIALVSLILMITMGIRQTVGLFVHPIISATNMSIVEMSMALAIGQLMWGAWQPVFGAWADKKGALPVLLTGAIILACAQVYTAAASSFLSMTLAQGILSPAGAAAGSFSVLIGIAAGRLAAEQRSAASGVINAGGTLGHFLFSPSVQGIINLKGYTSGLIFLAMSALACVIPSWLLCRGNAKQKPPPPALKAADSLGLKKQLAAAVRNPSYILLHAGFFTCGFHVAFLTTHLPSEVSLCGHSAAVAAVSLSLIGLCNIAGSILSGILGNYIRMKLILSAAYTLRALMIAVYLFSPKTEMTFYIFAVTTGLTWLATVPPTAGIVGKLFGTRYLATLFGLTLLTHQVGGFFGAWLGGLAIQTSGGLLWVWCLDIALAMTAALVNLPIKEAKPVRAGHSIN
jgi:predicted MFS family arabinose efflux permease